MDATVISTTIEGLSPQSTPCVVVAIPVRNERDRIGACLKALAAQVRLAPGEIGILLFLNNCTDDTAAAVAAEEMPWPMRVINCTDSRATAGWARRQVMNAASNWLGSGGILLTTDADSCVGPDWVARNLRAIAAGADLVAGRISLDPGEAAQLPEGLHARGRLEAAYERLLIEIEARLDPEPENPWPCHWSKSGATLAVRNEVYRLVGGMPDIAAGEDRAFVDTVRAHDLIVRHDSDIEIVTSGRLDGRAVGGVADTIKLRCDRPESPCDDRLERLSALIWRTLWRRRLRRLHEDGRLGATWRWAPALAISPQVARQITSNRHFGAAHAAIELASPRLSYVPMKPSQLPRQISLATIVVRVLRATNVIAARSARLKATRHATEQTLSSSR